jgi:hypothetical protein
VPVNTSETSYAVSFWFKTTSSFVGMYHIGNSVGFDGQVFLSQGHTCSRIFVDIKCSAKTYNDGRWHHVLHTFGGKTGPQELYVDGKMISKGELSSSMYDGIFIEIGRSSGYGEFFIGSIDRVRLYKTSLGG